MKLLTLQLTTNPMFRKRLLSVLSRRIESLHFRSDDPDSEDGEDRISNLEFLSAPHVYTVNDLGDDTAQINGDIGVAINFETMTHNADDEEGSKKSTNAYSFQYTVDVQVNPDLKDDVDQYIATAKFNVRSHNLSRR